MYKSILVISISMLSLIFAAEWIGITNENPTQSQAIILSGSESETTIEFTLDGFWKNRSSLGETGGYILELEEGTPLLEVTAPDVQKLSTSIIIPDFNNMEVEVLDFEYVNGKIIDTQTNSEWNYDGLAISGEYDAQRLERMPIEPGFWFEWVAFHPETLVYGDV